MEERIMSARTVEEAIELALKELEVDRDEAEVEILSRGKAGFLGIGAEFARVKVTKITEGPSAAAFAVENCQPYSGGRRRQRQPYVTRRR